MEEVTLIMSRQSSNIEAEDGLINITISTGTSALTRISLTPEQFTDLMTQRQAKCMGKIYS